MAPFLRGTRYVLLSPDEIKYLIHDKFSTALPAGSVNGTAAEPGPGTRTVVDTGSKLSIDSGDAYFNGGGGVWGDPGICYANIPVTRVAGRMLFGTLKAAATNTIGQRIQFNTSASSGLSATSKVGIYLGNTAGFNIYESSTITFNLIIAPFAANTAYKVVSILRGAGTHYLIKGGIYTNWTFLFPTNSSTDATLYAWIDNYSAVSRTSFIRIPDALYLSTPLLSDGFGSAFGTTDGLGHAEGIAGGIGAGGGGLTWLSAGTWATAGGVASCTPVAGVELVVNGDMETGDPPTGWTIGSCTGDGVVDERTGGSGVQSLALIRAGSDNGDAKRTIITTANNWYVFNGWVKKIDGRNPYFNIRDTSESILLGATTSSSSTSWVNKIISFKAISATSYIYCMLDQIGQADGTSSRYDDISIKPLPISSLITNQSLITTDVLAETVLSVYTLRTQAGLCQSDRPFAFPANANAAAGQAVIVLKNLTNAVPDTDSITIKHPITPTTYTIASVSALSGGVQTLTLDSNLVEAVAANDMVGVDWASWNGTLTYFDGAGNIKLDEVKAGVYTNRSSAAKAFSADARFIVRKIGTEYRWFYNEALIATITSVDAAAMVGTYWGLFSTDVSNTFTSTVIHDTGNVTAVHNSTLNKYSAD